MKFYFQLLWPTYTTYWNQSLNFSRCPPKNHSCQVLCKSIHLLRRCCFYDWGPMKQHMPDDKQKMITKAHPMHSVNEQTMYWRITFIMKDKILFCMVLLLFWHFFHCCLFNNPLWVLPLWQCLCSWLPWYHAVTSGESIAHKC